MVSIAKNEIIIVSPWIKRNTLQKVIDATKKKKDINWKILTRGNHKDFCEGLSDIDAFELMIENGVFEIRSNVRLHAKVYIVDGEISLVTSANLTETGMLLNPEVGIASEDPGEIFELAKVVGEWFEEANPLDHLWLAEEKQKLSEFEKEENVALPFDPANYHNLDEKNKKRIGGKYRELPLPDVWKPLLDALKETETPPSCGYLTMDSLIPTFIDFFGYLEKIQNGERHHRHLIQWFIQKQTIETIAKVENITKQRISQIIGKPGTDSGEIWKSEEGKRFARKLSLFLNGLVGETELRVSDVLSSTPLQPINLSHHDLCKFVCSMVEKGFITGNYHVKITPTNQFLVCNKHIYSILALVFAN